MGNQRNIKKERLKKEQALKQLTEISRVQMQTLAFLTGYQKFCKEKNMEFESNEYVNKFVKSISKENNIIDLEKLQDEMKKL